MCLRPPKRSRVWSQPYQEVPDDRADLLERFYDIVPAEFPNYFPPRRTIDIRWSWNRVQWCSQRLSIECLAEIVELRKK